MATSAALCDHVPVRHRSADRDGVSTTDALDLLRAQLGLGQRHGLEVDGVAGVTRWCVRVTLPGIPPADTVIIAAVVAAGLAVERLLPALPDRSRWLLLGPHSRAAVTAAAAYLHQVHRIQAVPFRRLTEHRQEQS